MTLTPRMTEVLRLTALGQTNRQIAEMLNVSTFTVVSDLITIKKKLKALNSCHAVTVTFRKGVLRWTNT